MWHGPNGPRAACVTGRATWTPLHVAIGRLVPHRPAKARHGESVSMAWAITMAINIKAREKVRLMLCPNVHAMLIIARGAGGVLSTSASSSKHTWIRLSIDESLLHPRATNRSI